METTKQSDGTATATMPPSFTSTVTTPEIIQQPTQPKERNERRKVANSLYEKIGRTGAYIGVIAIGTLLWYIGAFYTLAAIRSFNITTNGLLWWVIPVIVTLIELWLMPKKSQGWQLLTAFFFVLLIDIGTSWQGLTSFAGKTLPLFGGIHLPSSGIELHLTAAIIALILAFMPEKLVRAGIIEIKKVW